MMTKIWFACGLRQEARSKSSKVALLFFALSFVAAGVNAQTKQSKGSWDIKQATAEKPTSESTEANLYDADEVLLSSSSDLEPSANQEPSAIQQPSANQEPSAEQQPSDEDDSSSINLADEDLISEQQLAAEQDEIEQQLIEEANPDNQESVGSKERPSAGEEITEVDAASEPIRPVVNLDPQLRDDLQAQFNRMRERLETDDAFSEALGEDYLNYGLLLKRAGRLDEAIEKFTDALHLSKINNGVYAIEQRPILRALYDTHYLLGETEEFEANLKRILWIESKHPNLRDDYSYDLILKTGNHYVDLFLYKPIGGELGLSYLDSANKYFSYAIKRYDVLPLAERLLPYGELALVNLLRSKIEVQIDRRPTAPDRSRRFGVANFDQVNSENFLAESFSRGEFYLKKFLRKAQAEENQELIVQALLNIGDVNMLFFRKNAADHYYRLAWQEAQKLADDHPIVASFANPVELPAFKYAHQRHVVKRRDKSIYVPLTFDVEKSGRVTRIKAAQVGGEDEELFAKARRVAKRLIFRPSFEQGELIETQDFTHNVRVLVRQRNTG